MTGIAILSIMSIGIGIANTFLAQQCEQVDRVWSR